jgi:hypothetical protein
MILHIIYWVYELQTEFLRIVNSLPIYLMMPVLASYFGKVCVFSPFCFFAIDMLVHWWLPLIPQRLILQGIHAVNLGDSGFVVVRDGRTVLRSPSQQHDFNFTYQLESGGGSDLPSSAQVSKSQPFPLNILYRILITQINSDAYSSSPVEFLVQALHLQTTII